MQRSFDVGVTLLVVLTAVGEQLQHSAAVNSPAKKSETFSVWFRAEPDLPRKKDMKVEKLNRLIGSDYNEMWMSKTAIVTVRLAIMRTFFHIYQFWYMIIWVRYKIYTIISNYYYSRQCFQITYKNQCL